MKKIVLVLIIVVVGIVSYAYLQTPKYKVGSAVYTDQETITLENDIYTRGLGFDKEKYTITEIDNNVVVTVIGKEGTEELQGLEVGSKIKFNDDDVAVQVEGGGVTLK